MSRKYGYKCKCHAKWNTYTHINKQRQTYKCTHTHTQIHAQNTYMKLTLQKKAFQHIFMKTICRIQTFIIPSLKLSSKYHSHFYMMVTIIRGEDWEGVIQNFLFLMTLQLTTLGGLLLEQQHWAILQLNLRKCLISFQQIPLFH